ncbi:MAG: outer membrane lipoprotein-sorting protein [bacterium]|nr:outer membrane lipoprotein-sorting protein [bacterium]
MKHSKSKPLRPTVVFVSLLFCALVSPISMMNAASPAKHAAETRDQSPTGQEIMEQVDQRPEPQDSKARMKIVLIDNRNKTKERTTLTYTKKYGKDSKSLFYFLTPADVRGTGFLSWVYDEPGKDDDRWLYLPALKKSRRISGASKNGYFLGTDFTYKDMEKPSPEDYEHRFIKEESLGGKKCWVVESIPGEKGSIYSRTLNWVRQDALFTVKTEYYDTSARLLKILTVPELQIKNGFWTAVQMKMDNIREKHQTLFLTEEIQYNQGCKDNLFRVSALERGLLKK